MFRPTLSRINRLLGRIDGPVILNSVRIPLVVKTRLSLTSLEDRTVPTVLGVSVVSYTHALEGTTDGVFRFTRTGDASSSLDVHYTVGGTATSGTDFTALSGTVTFPATVDTVDVTVTITNDTASELTETIVFTVTSGTGYTIGTATATANLFDNDAQVVTVEKVADATEGGSDGTFRFTRIGDLSSSLVANFTVAGTATSGTDFTSIGTTVTFTAGEATADVPVATIDDNIYDPAETVEVTLGSGTGYTVGTADEAEVVLTDSARLTFTLNSDDGAIKYDIPWDDVDPDEASQSLALTNFVINIGGRTFTPSSSDATFVTAPTAHFEYGEFQGITFEIDTTLAGGGFAYTSVVGGFNINGDNIITAIQVGTNQQFVAAPVPQQFVNFDFTGVKTGRDYVIKLTFADGRNTEIVAISVSVSNTDNAGDIALKVVNAINAGTTKFSAVANGSDVKIKSQQGGRGWERLNYATYVNVGGVLVNDFTFAGPTITGSQTVSVTGQVTQLQP